MTGQLNIYCKNTEEYIPVDGGETLLEIYERIKDKKQNRLQKNAHDVGNGRPIEIDVRIELATTSDYALPESTFKRNKD